MKASAVRGVNVLSTIGVMLPVLVAASVEVARALAKIGTVAVGGTSVRVANGKTNSADSGRKISVTTNQMKTIRSSPTNNTSRNRRFSRSFCRKLIFTLTALLVCPLSRLVAELAAMCTSL